MGAYEQAITDNYGRTDLESTILTAYETAGKDPTQFTRDDIAALDEFHIKGRHATRELAHLAEICPDTRVLDVGSGIGGPARTLAAEFDCYVTGIDLVEEYCQVAKLLTDRVGLSERVTIQHGNALDLPFADDTFDVVWLQHVALNIEDKERFFDELHRVLRPEGRLALHEICAGPSEPPHFPVPWANDPSISFLAPPEELAQLLVETSFTELAWTETTDASLEWFRGKLEKMAARSADSSPPLGLNLLMGQDTPEKMKNVVRNLEEERIVVVQGVMKKPAQQ